MSIAGKHVIALEEHYYDHAARLAQLSSRMRLPEFATEDLFVAAFRKT